MLSENEPSKIEKQLSTIDTETLNQLCAEVRPETSPDLQSTDNTVTAVGEELIGTCVTPSKIKTVQHTLGKEKERHLCALKLLQVIFTNEELASSNTDGTYGKMCLDSGKLNSLKVLLFTKFPVGPNEDKDIVWRFIKGKINAKCRSIRKFLPTSA